jgi:plastocyanin domain-containing protein
MNRIASLVLPIALIASACGGTAFEPTPPATDPGEAAISTPAAAHLEGGVQVAALTVDGDHFKPAAVHLRSGVPARLVLTRTDAPTCVDSVAAPDLGVPTTAVPVAMPVSLEFTPAEEGDYTLACGMDMVTARLVIQS